MKKILSLLLCVLLLAAAASLPALAEESPAFGSVSSSNSLANAVQAAIQAAGGSLPDQEPETETPEETPGSEDGAEPAVIQEPPEMEAFADDYDDVQYFYVLDEADILTDSQEAALTEAAAEISQTYGCSVHIGTIEDMRDYGFNNIESCAEDFFNSRGLGLGEDRTGILLLLSMAERDYDIDAHGDFAHYAFTDYGKTTISAVFLDNFRANDWYGGFADYIDRCGVLLEQASQGDPLDVHNIPLTPEQKAAGLGLSAVLAIVIAFVVCSILKGKNKSVRTAADADQYLPAGAVQFRIRDDRFVNQTVTRVKIERSSGGGGGGTTISSGGHSHSSGKF